MLGSRAFRAQYPRSFCGIPLDMPWLPKPCLWSMWNHLKGMSQFVAPREQKKSCQTIQRPNKMFKVPFSTNLRMAAEGVRVPYPNQKIHSTTTNDLIVFFFVNCHPPMPCVFQFVPMPTGSKQQYRKYEWCYQTRHTHHAGGMSTNEDLQTDQCLMNLKHSPSS